MKLSFNLLSVFMFLNIHTALATEPEIPMIPEGVYIGLSMQDYLSLRPNAVPFELFNKAEVNTADDYPDDTSYIESERNHRYLKAVVCFFKDGFCSGISAEENYQDSAEYENARNELLNECFKTFGVVGEKKLLHMTEATGRKKDVLVKRGSPSLVWRQNDLNIMLTVTPDEVVQREGVGKLKMKVLKDDVFQKLEVTPVNTIASDNRFSAISRAERLHRDTAVE